MNNLQLIEKALYYIDKDALLDFEYYDERWDCQFGAAQMDIYVPVKQMED